jgi:hypothetical protein
VAVLTIDWQSPSALAAASDAVVTPREGETEEVETSEARPTASKPFFIYVTADASEEDGGFDKVESVIFNDDKVAVGANAFLCIRMTAEEAEAHPVVSEHGSEAPRFVFISHDFEEIEVLEGRRLGVAATYRTMKQIARASYTTNFDRNIRDLVRLLNEFDKIANERALLDEKAERDPTPAEMRRIEREREELAEREREANERKAELLAFELREA